MFVCVCVCVCVYSEYIYTNNFEIFVISEKTDFIEVIQNVFSQINSLSDRLEV